MSDYIERNALLYDIRIAKMLAFGILETKLVEDIIEQQPTADVVERKHGKWKKMDKHGRNVQCSICGNTLALYGVNAGRGDANYCPHCGARMVSI